MCILFTGGSGFLGKTFQDNNFEAVYLSSKDVDLIDKDSVFSYFDSKKPTCIIHAANKVGGILKNATSLYTFYYDNLLMNTNVIDYCARKNVKLIMFNSTCAYPKWSSLYPMTEEMIHDGLPEQTNLGYAYSKRVADIQLWAAEKELNYKNYLVLYLSNLYGKRDHYFSEDSHFVASFISKIFTTKEDVIELYGTGKPLRQFTYSDDVVKVVNQSLKINLTGRYNVANPENLSIKDMAEIMLECFSIDKKLKFNQKLDGVFRKDVSSEKLLSVMPDIKFTSFEKGIKELAKDKTCFGV